MLWSAERGVRGVGGLGREVLVYTGGQEWTRMIFIRDLKEIRVGILYGLLSSIISQLTDSTLSSAYATGI